MPRDCNHLVLKSTAKGGKEGTEYRTEKIKKGKKEKKKNLLSQSARSMTLVCNALAFTLVSGNARAGSVTQIGVISAQRSRASAPSAISGGWGAQCRKQEKRQLPGPKAQMGVLLQDPLFQALNSSIYYKALVFTSC